MKGGGTPLAGGGGYTQAMETSKIKVKYFIVLTEPTVQRKTNRMPETITGMRTPENYRKMELQEPCTKEAEKLYARRRSAAPAAACQWKRCQAPNSRCAQQGKRNL